ncbi:hypothetical protein ACFLUH_02860 [Chloroflexota bacterium]
MIISAMPEDITRELAALVAIVSIALIGATVVLLPLAWKRFEKKFLKLPSYKRKGIMKNSLIVIIPIFTLVGIQTIIGVYWPSNFQEIVVSLMLLFMVIYIPVVLVLKRKGKIQKQSKLDNLPFIYFLILVFLASSIMFSVFALLGVTPTMLAIEIGPYNPENFNSGRWMLQDSIFLFVSGIWMLGFAYLDDRTREWKASNE